MIKLQSLDKCRSVWVPHKPRYDRLSLTDYSPITCYFLCQAEQNRSEFILNLCNLLLFLNKFLLSVLYQSAKFRITSTNTLYLLLYQVDYKRLVSCLTAPLHCSAWLFSRKSRHSLAIGTLVISDPVWSGLKMSFLVSAIVIVVGRKVARYTSATVLPAFYLGDQ